MIKNDNFNLSWLKKIKNILNNYIVPLPLGSPQNKLSNWRGFFIRIQGVEKDA